MSDDDPVWPGEGQYSPSDPDPLKPAIDEALHFHGSDKLDRAAQIYREVLKQKANHPIALHYLGVISLQKGDAETAIKLISDAVVCWPYYADAHINLGNSLQSAGRHKEAVSSYEHALEIDSENPETYANMGNARSHLSLFEAAVSDYETAIKLASAVGRNLPEVQRNLATVLLKINKPDEALKSIVQANRQQLHSPAIQLTMANILQELARYDDAVSCYREILIKHPGSPQVHTNLGNVLRYMGQLNESFDHYNKALQLAPDYVEGYFNRAVAHLDNGNIESSREDLQRAIDLDPGYGKAHRLLASFTEHTDDLHADIEALEAAFKETSNQNEQKVHLAFSLGKSFERRKEYDKSFAYYRIANTLRRKAVHYRAKEESKFFDNLKNTFDESFLSRHAITNYRDSHGTECRPIFIIGMPRSGTTLVEQILASHPNVYGAGELSYLPQCIASVLVTRDGVDYTDSLRQLQGEKIQAIASSYLKKLQTISTDSSNITDKLPMNFFHVGMIKLVFPDARVIHCNRNPLDTCFSIYKNFFAAQGHNYSYDLVELGEFYNLYQDLMAHWRSVMPEFMVEINYESLVDRQEDESRRLIAACGLEWHDACLDFHKTKRQVLTLSAAQVRKPMYDQSVGLWRHYEEGLAPLIEIIAAK